MADVSHMSPEQALSAIIDDAVRRVMVEIASHVPATVISFARRPRAEISVSVGMRARLRSGQTVAIGQIDRVPVIWPASGRWCMDADLDPGDEVLLLVMDRDISGWLQSGKTSDPATGLLHHISCCVALADSLRSDAKVARAVPGAGTMYLGQSTGTPPWIRLATLPTPHATLEAPAINIGEGATLAAARQTDAVTPDAAWLAWFASVSVALAGLGIPTPTPIPPAGVPFARITGGSTSVRVK